jgi:hypothetical protein
LIDPHGHLVDRIAAKIPDRQDVIYLNVPDPAQLYGYNQLRHVEQDRIALAASGMMEVFKKMWPDAWGVRMEHILHSSGNRSDRSCHGEGVAVAVRRRPLP